MFGSAQATCPGRICLGGEELDWIGGRTLLATIGLHVSVQAAVRRAGDDDADVAIVVHSSDAGRLDDQSAQQYPRAAVDLVEEVIDHRLTGTLTVDGDLLVGAGLASSAAVIVATLASVCAAIGRPAALVEIAEWAYEVEVHRLGSGAGRMDFGGCATGGVLAMDFGPGTWSAKHLPMLPFAVVIGDSGTRQKTSESIHRKRLRLHNGDPALQRYAAGTRTLVDELEQQLAGAVSDTVVGRLLGELHRLLADEMRVSTPPIDAMIAAAYDAGAVGAKLCGAGEGGCMFALCRHDAVPAVRDAIAACGGQAIATTLTRDGLRMSGDGPAGHPPASPSTRRSPP